MEADGVITPVNISEWAAPIVNIPTVDLTVRICGDYKVFILGPYFARDFR